MPFHHVIINDWDQHSLVWKLFLRCKIVRDPMKDIEKPKELVSVWGLFKILLQAVFSLEKECSSCQNQLSTEKAICQSVLCLTQYTELSSIGEELLSDATIQNFVYLTLVTCMHAKLCRLCLTVLCP